MKYFVLKFAISGKGGKIKRKINNQISLYFMVLGKLPVPGRPTIWIIVWQGPIALAADEDGVVWTFLLSSIFTLLFLPLFGKWPDVD